MYGIWSQNALIVVTLGLRNVERISFVGNPLERFKEIPESRGRMLSVTEVKMTDTNLSTISTDDLDLLPVLKTLDLSGNRLSRIAPYAFRSLGELVQMDLSKNMIMQLNRERFYGLFQVCD